MMKRVRDRKIGCNVGWFYDPTYRANVELIWPVTGDMVSAYVKKRCGIDYPIDQAFGAKCVEVLTDNGDTHLNIVCLTEWNLKDASDVAMLAHEVFHCAEHILSRRGIDLVSKVTTEPYAYLIESIMRRCLYLLEK